MAVYREDFESIYQKHYPQIEKLVSRYAKNSDDGADLTQEVFIRAFKAYSSFRGDASVSTWLHRIALNTCAMAARSQVRRPEVSLADVELVADVHSSCDTERQFLHAQDHKLLKRALASLTPEQSVVLTLRFSEQLRLREIAEVLGVPIQTVQSRVRRGLAKLEEMLRQYEKNGVATGDIRSQVDEIAVENLRLERQQGAKIYHSLGSLYLKKGLIEAAFREWGKAQKTDPAFIQPYMASAQQHIRMSRPDKAVSVPESAVGEVRDASLHVTLTHLYLRDDQLEDAVNHSLRAVNIEPQNPDAHMAAGQSFMRQAYYYDRRRQVMAMKATEQNDPQIGWNNSVRHFGEVLKMKPDSALANACIAGAYAKLQQFPDALQAAHTALSLSDDDETVLYAAANVHSDLANWELAENYAEQCLNASDTKQGTKWWMLGHIYKNMNRNEDAYSAFRKAIEVGVNRGSRSQLLAYAAIATLDTGRIDEAIELAEKSLKLDPAYIDARVSLVEAYVQKGVNPAYIERVCREGLALTPDGMHKNLTYQFAEVLAQQGKYVEALPHATVAVECKPRGKRLALRAEILIKLGRSEEAKPDLEKALEINPENEKAKSLLKELAESD